jgi:hypothetical protein
MLIFFLDLFSVDSKYFSAQILHISRWKIERSHWSIAHVTNSLIACPTSSGVNPLLQTTKNRYAVRTCCMPSLLRRGFICLFFTLFRPRSFAQRLRPCSEFRYVKCSEMYLIVINHKTTKAQNRYWTKASAEESCIHVEFHSVQNITPGIFAREIAHEIV